MAGDLYRNARKTAGLTQERWAELLGLSTEAVRQYEAGQILPGDEVALRMAEVSGQTIVCYWHLLNKSRVAAELLPSVADVPLPQAVLQLLRRMRDFDRAHKLEELVAIAEDGGVDEKERPRFDAIADDLIDIVAAAMAVKFTGEASTGINRDK